MSQCMKLVLVSLYLATCAFNSIVCAGYMCFVKRLIVSHQIFSLKVMREGGFSTPLCHYAIMPLFSDQKSTKQMTY